MDLIPIQCPYCRIKASMKRPVMIPSVSPCPKCDKFVMFLLDKLWKVDQKIMEEHDSEEMPVYLQSRARQIVAENSDYESLEEAIVDTITNAYNSDEWDENPTEVVVQPSKPKICPCPYCAHQTPIIYMSGDNIPFGPCPKCKNYTAHYLGNLEKLNQKIMRGGNTKAIEKYLKHLPEILLRCTIRRKEEKEILSHYLGSNKRLSASEKWELNIALDKAKSEEAFLELFKVTDPKQKKLQEAIKKGKLSPTIRVKGEKIDATFIFCMNVMIKTIGIDKFVKAILDDE